MNNQIINFTFEAQTVRTATNPQGEIYFCLPDVANVLEISRSSDLLQVQKDFVKNETPKKRGMLDPKGVARLSTPTKGGTQQITFISEPNLYRVIFRSNKAEAVKFQNWVFDEVRTAFAPQMGQYLWTWSKTLSNMVFAKWRNSAIAFFKKTLDERYQI
ncbi:hypothetical protein LP123_07310 [Moraxella bovis]|uniref:BRO-N domain-containing protein n=1 Tax=Moraxella bovis TaxID=476 RepID=UPI002226F4AC|nr:BRO family protein [Moraxella bovis]UZA04925.1 hypothetical protein LP099_06975 [Moraxella bovis]UZA12837.1 hypothetical protein LP123_07310 [Moraxella bovis]